MHLHMNMPRVWNRLHILREAGEGRVIEVYGVKFEFFDKCAMDPIDYVPETVSDEGSVDSSESGEGSSTP